MGTKYDQSTGVHQVLDDHRVNQLIEQLKNDLGDGFLATDIWTTAYGQPLVGYRSKPNTAAMFNEVTQKLDKTLQASQYPGLGNYYLVNLANNRLAVIVSNGTYQQLLLVDLSKTTMGMLMSVVLPRLLGSLKEITRPARESAFSKLRLPTRGL
jgi:hypothetical protein